MRNGSVHENASDPVRNICNPRNSPGEIAALIEATEPFQGPVNFTKGPLTFKLRRDSNFNTTASTGEEELEEILEIRGDVDYARLEHGEMLAMTAFAFHPAAAVDESLGCAEYLGARWLFTHVGISPDYPPQDVWRMGIRHQLRLMGTDNLDYLVVTLTGSSAASPNHGILLTSARIIYSKE